MLGWRLAISAILIPTLFGLFWLDHRSGPDAPWLLALCILLAVRSTWELTELLKTRSMRPSFGICACAVVAIVASTWIVRWRGHGTMPIVDSLIAFAIVAVAAVYLCFVAAAVRFREPGHTMETLGAEIFAVFYCGILLAMTAQMRWLGPDSAWGYAALGSLLLATKCGDIGGYTLGRLFGKRKMAPWLSPGKTWAGFGGALLGAALGTWLWVTFAIPRMVPGATASSVVNVLAFGIVMGFVGLVGDLCESLIKRDVGKKDAAALFPGFGGLLDLLDSVLFAGPIAWLWWTISPLIR